jgi:hypothetical protein
MIERKKSDSVANSEKIFISKHDPEKWSPVFEKDHAQTKIGKTKWEWLAHFFGA